MCIGLPLSWHVLLLLTVINIIIKYLFFVGICCINLSDFVVLVPESIDVSILFTTRSDLRKVLFLAPSVCGLLFVYEISREPLNEFAPNSQGRRGFVSRSDEFEYQRQRSIKVTRDKNGIFGLLAACVRFYV